MGIVTSRKRRLLNPGLAWPLTSTELAEALGIDASNYGDDHIVWRFWERTPSTTPITVRYYGPKTEVLHSGPQISVSPVARSEREPVHSALLATGLSELAAWISSLPAMPEPYLDSKPTVTWTWDGAHLRRSE